jgi:serine/threonine protein kinase
MDMKQLGEKQRSRYFPWIDVPVYTYAQVQQMLQCLVQLRETGIINSDMKRDNILVRPSQHEMCVTDFGFSGDMNHEYFTCKIGWPQAYYPPESKWTPTAAQQKHWRHQFMRLWTRYAQYVDLWEWEAEMLFMGVRIWFTNEYSQEAATRSSLKVFVGLGENILPNSIRQQFIKVNPYIYYCYQREARDHAHMCPTQLYSMDHMDL